MTLSHSLHLHESFFEEEYKRPAAPSHRHAAPSAPWPWIDIDDGAKDISSPIHSSISTDQNTLILQKSTLYSFPLPYHRSRSHASMSRAPGVGATILNRYTRTGRPTKSRKA